MDKIFKEYHLKTPIKVDNLMSFLYYDISKEYSFEGEEHEFWELVYVDHGELLIARGRKIHTVGKGKLVLHPPGEFHSIRGNGRDSSCVFIISFTSSSKDLMELSRGIYSATSEHGLFIKSLYSEGDKAFKNCRVKDSVLSIEEKQNQTYGAEQFVKIYLEALLITMMRDHIKGCIDEEISDIKYYTDEEIDIVDFFLIQNLGQVLTLENIASATGIGIRKLQYLVKEKRKMTMSNYIKVLRIEKAKELLRLRILTITDISEQLGYNSIHYFSTQFKKECGITPSEYAKALKYQGHSLSYRKVTDSED